MLFWIYSIQDVCFSSTSMHARFFYPFLPHLDGILNQGPAIRLHSLCSRENHASVEHGGTREIHGQWLDLQTTDMRAWSRNLKGDVGRISTSPHKHVGCLMDWEKMHSLTSNMVDCRHASLHSHHTSTPWLQWFCQVTLQAMKCFHGLEGGMQLGLWSEQPSIEVLCPPTWKYQQKRWLYSWKNTGITYWSTLQILNNPCSTIL